MPNSWMYPLEKFETAVDSLAISASDIRQRIQNAYLSFFPVDADELSETIRAKFESLITDLTKYDAIADEGSVAATLQRLSDAECEAIAKKIVDIHYALREEEEAAIRRGEW